MIPLPFPYELSHIWAWFQRMNQMRQNNGFGVSRLSGEIVAWQQLEGIRLNPYELDVIAKLDEAFVLHHSKAEEVAPED